MAQEMKHFSIHATILTTALIHCFQLILTVVCDPEYIPPDSSKLDGWIAQNIKHFEERKSHYLSHAKNIDQVLTVAEKNVKIITVSKDDKGDFKTVNSALKSIPSGNSQRVVVNIGGGEYVEKITLDRSKKFITFYGDPSNMPKLVYDGTAAKYGTWNSATVAVESDYFMAINIAFVNSAPMPDSKRVDAQAVAMRISGDKAAFHNCRFIGYQDTLCDDKGRHFFKDCYIEGTVDFIFGNGKSLYLNTNIHSVAKNLGVITAHARDNVNDDSGFTFVHCNITGTGDTYLGRAWKERPRVIFAHTNMGPNINDMGWSDGQFGKPDRSKTVYYGEYKCMGPGASSSARPKFVKILSDAEAQPFLSITFLNGNEWLLPPPKL